MSYRMHAVGRFGMIPETRLKSRQDLPDVNTAVRRYFVFGPIGGNCTCLPVVWFGYLHSAE
jgi:hypothetical protein